MTSDTRIAYGSWVRRQRRSRAFWPYQSKTASCIASSTAAGIGARYRLPLRRGAPGGRRPGGPPHAVADVEQEPGNEDAADDQGVDENAERDDEADLGQRDEGKHAENEEGAGQHDAGTRDHAAGDGQAAQRRFVRAVGRRVLANACGEEDVVVDPQRDQEDEGQEQERWVGAGEPEYQIEQERAQADGGEVADHDGRDEEQRQDERPQQDDENQEHHGEDERHEQARVAAR